MGDPKDFVSSEEHFPSSQLAAALIFLLMSSAPTASFGKNVILFVGDGMGLTTTSAARIHEAQRQKQDWQDNTLSFEELPNVALVRPHTVDAQIPDSAGTMSAIMTGIKTRSGVISVTPKYQRGDCKSVFEDPPETLMEFAKRKGLSTGLVTNSRITDATPAAAYAHSPDRTWENDARTPESALAKGCGDLASQLIAFSEGEGIDLVLGGGRANFLPESESDPERPEITGERLDDRDLILEWLRARSNRTYVWNLEQFNALAPSSEGQILGLFEPATMLFNEERIRGAGDEPSLTEMTTFAINFMQASSDNQPGYFLIIEGARIDHGNHFKNPFLALTETVEFSNAIRAAMELVDLEETLLLVTADHSSSLAFTGYPEADMPVLASLSYPSFTFMAGDGFQQDHMQQEQDDPLAYDPEDQVAPHAGEDVAAYAAGYQSDRIRGTLDQHRLYDIIKSALE